MSSKEEEPSWDDVRNTWLRNIRKDATGWAKTWEPPDSMIGLDTMKESLFSYLARPGKKHFGILNQPGFAMQLFWPPIKDSTTREFKNRGWHVLPAVNAKNRPPIATTFTLTRIPDESDEPEYMELVATQLEVKQERLANAGASFKRQSELTGIQKDVLTGMAVRKRKQNKAA